MKNNWRFIRANNGHVYAVLVGECVAGPFKSVDDARKHVNTKKK